MTLAQLVEHVAIDVDTVRASVVAEGGQIRPRDRRPRTHPHGAKSSQAPVLAAILTSREVKVRTGRGTS